MGNKNYENFEMDKLKDKVVVLLGKTGEGKSTFINCITNKNECKVDGGYDSCTQEIQDVAISKNGVNYYFIDTPGLDDALGDEKNIEQLNIIRKKYPRINVFIICISFFDYRLSESLVKAIKKFMEIFPCPNFWEHVLILRTKAARTSSFELNREKVEGQLLKGINNNRELNSFMKEKQIKKPTELKEYYVECYDKDNDTLNELEKIIQEIKTIHPIYKEVKEKVKESIEQEIKDGAIFACIKRVKYITFIDFDGKIYELPPQILDNEEYNLNGYKPSLTTVQRKQTQEPRGSLCWKNQFKTIYKLVNIYKIN